MRQLIAFILITLVGLYVPFIYADELQKKSPQPTQEINQNQSSSASLTYKQDEEPKLNCRGATCRKDCRPSGNDELCNIYCVETNENLGQCLVKVNCPLPCR